MGNTASAVRSVSPATGAGSRSGRGVLDRLVVWCLGAIWAFAAAAPDARLWYLADAEHTQALSTHPVEYRDRVLDVFDRMLTD